jgi:hypothetical protein
MTVVLVDTEDNELLFGADSAASGQDEEIYTFDTEKVFEREGYLFGYCGSYRIGQILRHCVELPKIPEDPEEPFDMERFLVRELLPPIRQAVTAEGAAGAGRAILGDKTAILLGCRRQIWRLGTNLTVNRETPFAAIGSGRSRAYGALHALHAAGFGPLQQRVELALQATAAFTANVRPPFHFVGTGAGLK